MRRPLTILDLKFISILDERPKQNQFIMLAWDIKGYCGYESTYWDNTDEHCKHAVAWFPLRQEHVYTKSCAVVLKKRFKYKVPKLKWSHHFSIIKDNKYISKDRLPKLASNL